MTADLPEKQDTKDLIIRATGKTTPLRFIVADLTETMNAIGKWHNAEAWCLVQMAETAIAANFLATSLKFAGTVSLRADFSGDLSMVQADATPMGLVRASIPQDEIKKAGDFELMLIPQKMHVRKFNEHAKQISEGITEMVNHRMSQNLAAYLMQSEQLRTAVGIDAKPDPDHPDRLLYAIGFYLEAFPDAQEKELIIMEEVVRHLPPLESFYNGTEYRLHDLLDQMAGPVDFQIHREIAPQPYCPCDKARSLASLASLDSNTLHEMIESGEDLEIVCDFCRSRYLVPVDEITDIIRRKNGPSEGET